MTGIAAIAGRIAEVRALVGETVAPPRAPIAASAASTALGAGDAANFADALARLNGSGAANAWPVTAPTVGPIGDAAGSAGAAGGQAIVDRARAYLGVPYVFGGEDASGMDCSGLVQRVLADLGVAVPRVVPDQARVGTEVPSLADARPGDLIVTRDRGHIVIYAGDGMILHAPRPGKNVELIKNYLGPGDIGTIRRIDTAGGSA